MASCFICYTITIVIKLIERTREGEKVDHHSLCHYRKILQQVHKIEYFRLEENYKQNRKQQMNGISSSQSLSIPSKISSASGVMKGLLSSHKA